MSCSWYILCSATYRHIFQAQLVYNSSSRVAACIIKHKLAWIRDYQLQHFSPKTQQSLLALIKLKLFSKQCWDIALVVTSWTNGWNKAVSSVKDSIKTFLHEEWSKQQKSIYKHKLVDLNWIDMIIYCIGMIIYVRISTKWQ